MNHNNNIIILKASGEKEAFKSEKLKHSLYNAGADSATVDGIVHNINDWIYDGISTKKIYQKAFTLLRKQQSKASIRYRLKKAIFELGPSGYPFENFIGQLFDRQGYKTEVGIVVDGNCVTHEMDVIASKDGTQHLMECKYHKDQGKHVSVQVPLYVNSRVDDIVKKRLTLPEYKGYNFEAWVVTNTRFSTDSIQYGNCSGLNLLAWDYPVGNGLKELVESLKIYPITILHHLTMKLKQELMGEDIITCQQLLSKKEILQNIGLSSSKIKAIIKELEDINTF